MDFVVEYWKKHKYSPSYREIAAAVLGIRSGKPLSTSYVNYSLDIMQKLGMLTYEKGIARTIVPANMEVIFYESV